MNRKEELYNELMKVVRRISSKENATPEELEALAKVAEVIAVVLIH